MIPAEIPKKLRGAAIVPKFAGEYEAAWTTPDALAVLEALQWTRIAVVRAQALTEMGGVTEPHLAPHVAPELVPTNDSWTLHETIGETETSRAQKSLAAAAHFIHGLRNTPYVLLEFSYQDDAA